MTPLDDAELQQFVYLRADGCLLCGQRRSVETHRFHAEEGSIDRLEGSIDSEGAQTIAGFRGCKRLRRRVTRGPSGCAGGSPIELPDLEISIWVRVLSLLPKGLQGVDAGQVPVVVLLVQVRGDAPESCDVLVRRVVSSVLKR
jgi:hypothetical protein